MHNVHAECRALLPYWCNGARSYITVFFDGYLVLFSFLALRVWRRKHFLFLHAVSCTNFLYSEQSQRMADYGCCKPSYGHVFSSFPHDSILPSLSWCSQNLVCSHCVLSLYVFSLDLLFSLRDRYVHDIIFYSLSVADHDCPSVHK